MARDAHDSSTSPDAARACPRDCLLRAAHVVDLDGVCHSPGQVRVANGRAAAFGPAGDDADGLPAVELQASMPGTDSGPFLVLPGLVNAHAHLDLTLLGPVPRTPGQDFAAWATEVVWPARRFTKAEALEASVCDGIAVTRQAGVAAIGDMAASITALNAFVECDVPGRTYLELYGYGPETASNVQIQIDALRLLRDELEPELARRVGLQPHAPYSAGPYTYAACADTDLPLATHLAEHAAEVDFVANQRGFFREELERYAQYVVDLPGYGEGLSPTACIEPVLRKAAGRFVAAHANFVEDADLTILAETRTSVACCPVASDYFHHPLPPFRAMDAAGVNICLGTDSVICQPADEPQPHGILPQMRRLFREAPDDAELPALLVRMATANGYAALDLDPAACMDRLCIVPLDGEPAGDPLRAALAGSGIAEAYELSTGVG